MRESTLSDSTANIRANFPEPPLKPKPPVPLLFQPTHCVLAEAFPTFDGSLQQECWSAPAACTGKTTFDLRNSQSIPQSESLEVEPDRALGEMSSDEDVFLSSILRVCESDQSLETASDKNVVVPCTLCLTVPGVDNSSAGSLCPQCSSDKIGSLHTTTLSPAFPVDSPHVRQFDSSQKHSCSRPKLKRTPSASSFELLPLNSYFGNPRKFMLVFQTLFIPPVLFLNYPTNRREHKLVGSCRLPWHAPSRKSSSRILDNLGQSSSKSRKQTVSSVIVRKNLLASRSSSFGSSCDSPDVALASHPAVRRSYASVVGSVFRSKDDDPWLTPAEAAAVKNKISVHSIPPSTAPSTPFKQKTFNRHTKFSLASAKLVRDSYTPIVDLTFHNSLQSHASNTTHFLTGDLELVSYVPAHTGRCCLPPEAPPIQLESSLGDRSQPCSSSVIVDLTGYDVTVSVERLPPVTEPVDRFRRPRMNRNHERSHANTNTSHSTPSDSLSPSPPPPYSECIFQSFCQTSSACAPRTSHLDSTFCWCPRCVQAVENTHLPNTCPCFSLAAAAAHTSCGRTGCVLASSQYHYHCCMSGLCCPNTPRAGSTYAALAPSNYVYIPEPIRVSRSQDVYNALRTCLVPHYELRNYFTTAPPQRQWRKLGELSKDGFPFTLMCYNVLSPNYATASMYPYCPSWALSWDYRRRFILDEIRMYHANIVCLQEVETDQFEEIFKPELQKLKYDAVFLPKSRRRTMDMKDCKKVDGCAIFWQVDKFEKVHEFYHEFMFSCSNMCENPTPLLVNRVMTRDNVALGVIFETKGPTGPDGPGGRQFCVTTGHIHWDPEHSDVKMIQTILWTAELWAHIDQYLTGSDTGTGRSSPGQTRVTPLSNKIPVPGPSSPAAHMPVILCGDLNSLPNSGVVEFLMRGSLPKTHTDFLNNGFKYMFEDWRLLEKWAVDGDTLRHRFMFDRAYTESQGMRMTNFTYEFKGMIDYVLYSRQHFRLLGSLDQIHESYFTERKILGCPHVHFPSDHFALLVELELKPTPQLSSYIARRARQLALDAANSVDAPSGPVESLDGPASSVVADTDEGSNTPNGGTKSRKR